MDYDDCQLRGERRTANTIFFCGLGFNVKRFVTFSSFIFSFLKEKDIVFSGNKN